MQDKELHRLFKNQMEENRKKKEGTYVEKVDTKKITQNNGNKEEQKEIETPITHIRKAIGSNTVANALGIVDPANPFGIGTW